MLRRTRLGQGLIVLSAKTAHGRRLWLVMEVDEYKLAHCYQEHSPEHGDQEFPRPWIHVPEPRHSKYPSDEGLEDYEGYQQGENTCCHKEICKQEGVVRLHIDVDEHEHRERQNLTEPVSLSVPIEFSEVPHEFKENQHAKCKEQEREKSSRSFLRKIVCEHGQAEKQTESG